MVLNPKFLIVDDNADSRFLLVKTLLRKFPAAVALECQHPDTAVQIAREENPHVIVTHRAGEVDGITLIRMLRDANAAVPIVMVSGLDRSQDALSAGATAFLNYDEWLRIGTVVSELMQGQKAASDPR